MADFENGLSYNVYVHYIQKQKIAPFIDLQAKKVNPRQSFDEFREVRNHIWVNFTGHSFSIF